MPRFRRATLFPARSVFLLWTLLAALAGCTPPKPPTVPIEGSAAPATAPAATTPAVRAFDPAVFAPITPWAQTSRVPVIMYHDIIARRGPGSVWFDCTKDEFEAQLQWLADQGAQPISLERLHRHLTRGEPVPPGAIVLTFDDNYQGFYDNAYPLLKAYNYPAAMFVHTNFVGDKTGAHPKMDWATLRALDKEGLVTIASHTLSHPDDMSTLPLAQQERELIESKAILERELGHPVPYFAYPNGKGDAATFDAARRAGYTMAFTIANELAEESPGVMTVGRTIHTRLEKAWEETQSAILNAPAIVYTQPMRPGPVQLEVGEYAGVKLGLVRGGTPATFRASGRQSVGTFVQEANGVAGINGTFFANAALKGTDNAMIGPCQTTRDDRFVPETEAWRLPRLINRPLVVWGPTRLAIVPFQPWQMNDADTIRAFMPDYTNVFLAGAWIVQSGAPRTSEELKPYAVGDFDQTRRRAFFGVTTSGEVVLGASLEVVGTARLAEAAAEAGVYQAVLLDSGFSTSLIYDDKIIVTGHTARHLPSRPVPHAIVLTGTLEPPADPDVQRFLQRANRAVEPPRPAKKTALRTP